MFTIVGKIKNYAILALLVVILILALFGFGQRSRARKAEDERDDRDVELEVKTQRAVTYQNELDQKVLAINGYTKYVEDLEFSNDSLEVKVYETIAASNLQKRQLKSAISLASTTVGVGMLHTDTIYIDSIEVREVKTFSDGFLFLTVESNDSINYQYTDSLVIIQGKRLVDRKFVVWRWIKWQKMIDKDLIEVVSANPNTTIHGRFFKID
tara:strand:- start:45516 stop:46148 length:633 start_codon:yes stop_codon:yes gene_type:complete